MKKKNIEHVGDGKTKETAIYFLNARHGQDEEAFEGRWLEVHNIQIPPIADKNSEYYGSCELDVNHEMIHENGTEYIRYNTTNGDLWFKQDREFLEAGDEYLKWLEEEGL